MKVTTNWLSEVTGKHAATVKKRIAQVAHDSDGKVDSAAALEVIYCGGRNGNGEFISNPESIRLLNIARKEEIDLDMEIKRGDRIPKEDCALAHDEVFQSIAGTLKANRNKPLSDSLLSEIFDQFREVGESLK